MTRTNTQPSYLIYPFHRDAIATYRMKAIPNSKAKFYAQRGYMASQAGLRRYWQYNLAETLENQHVPRIILIDHSFSGRSVDGFRSELLDAAHAGGGEAESNRLSHVPMWLINVIDGGISPNSVTNPTSLRTGGVLAKLSEGRAGLVNRMVGDEGRHPRVQPDYPPTKFEVSARSCWSSSDRQYAQDFQNKIIVWNQRHGGLIRPGTIASKKPVVPSKKKGKNKSTCCVQ